MADVLPTLFLIAVGVALSLVLLALWHSVRGVLEHARDAGARVTAGDAARAALLREKDELLAAIRELRFEHELGKVSQADFDRLEQRYRTRARDVLRELDEQIAPFRARATALLEQALAGGEPANDVPAVAPSADAKVPDGAEPVAPATSSPPPPASERAVACASCGTGNDGDALFCKKCGRRLREEASA